VCRVCKAITHTGGWGSTGTGVPGGWGERAQGRVWSSDDTCCVWIIGPRDRRWLILGCAHQLATCPLQLAVDQEGADHSCLHAWPACTSLESGPVQGPCVAGVRTCRGQGLKRSILKSHMRRVVADLCPPGLEAAVSWGRSGCCCLVLPALPCTCQGDPWALVQSRGW
jgi:hypothetical protein